MQFSKKLEFAREFANFCDNLKFNSYDAAVIVKRAHRVFLACAAKGNANIGPNKYVDRYDAEIASLESFMEPRGFKLDTSGPFPSLVRESDGAKFRIPSL